MITISGYGALERENVANLCKLLGGVTQGSLCIKSYNEMLPNTHLICKQALGPKYIAAKSWGLPIVSAEWVVECCVTGMRAEEKKYSVENQANGYRDLIEGLAKVRRNEETSSTSSTCASSKPGNENDSTLLLMMNARNLSRMEKNESKVEEAEMEHQEDTSLSYPSETKKPRLENSNQVKETSMYAQNSFRNSPKRQNDEETRINTRNENFGIYQNTF